MSTCNSCTFTAKRSLRLYEYGGVVSEQFINLNVSDVRLNAFLEAFDLAQLTQAAPRAAELVQEIKSKLQRSPDGDSISATDDRVLYALHNLMVKYPDALEVVGSKEQWVVVFEYLRRFYDSIKGVNRIDDLVRVVNLQMGLTFATEQVKPEEALELMKMELDETWDNVVPRFVVNSILYNADALTPFGDSIKEFEINQLFNKLYEAIEAA